MSSLLTNAFNLSKREISVLSAIAKGLNSEKTGEVLSISTSTVQTHRRNMLRKTGFSNTHQLVAWAVSSGMLKYQ